MKVIRHVPMDEAARGSKETRTGLCENTRPQKKKKRRPTKIDREAPRDCVVVGVVRWKASWPVNACVVVAVIVVAVGRGSGLLRFGSRVSSWKKKTVSGLEKILFSFTPPPPRFASARGCTRDDPSMSLIIDHIPVAAAPRMGTAFALRHRITRACRRPPPTPPRPAAADTDAPLPRTLVSLIATQISFNSKGDLAAFVMSKMRPCGVHTIYGAGRQVWGEEGRGGAAARMCWENAELCERERGGFIWRRASATSPSLFSLFLSLSLSSLSPM
jgi:hypothetical protein